MSKMNKLKEKVLKEFDEKWSVITKDGLIFGKDGSITVDEKGMSQLIPIRNYILKVIDMTVDNCDKDKWLGFYRDDILNGFTPKCSCGEIATTQTTRGEHAQEGLHRPCNWGYYCKKCYAEGLELELEAMGVYDK